MAVSEEEAIQIVEGLLSATKSGDLVWSLWEHGSDEFTADSERFTYYVKSRDEDDAPPYQFQIFRRLGGEPPRVTKVLDLLTVAEQRRLVALLGELLMAAKLKLLGITSLKDAVLGDLGLGE